MSTFFQTINIFEFFLFLGYFQLLICIKYSKYIGNTKICNGVLFVHMYMNLEIFFHKLYKRPRVNMISIVCRSMASRIERQPKIHFSPFYGSQIYFKNVDHHQRLVYPQTHCHAVCLKKISPNKNWKNPRETQPAPKGKTLSRIFHAAG